MGDKSAIQWTDATWNPVVGCSKVSPGCAHCYAETVHKNRMDGRHGYPTFKPWTPENAEHNVTLLPERLDQPLRWTKPRMVFVNSMSDLFHEQVPDEFIAQVFAIMAIAGHHKYQVLTKRPERMRKLVGSPLFAAQVGELRVQWAEANLGRKPSEYLAEMLRVPTWPLPSVWLGVSIENRQFVHRADLLRETPAAVRFISAEPLLGPLRFDAGDISCEEWPIYTSWSDGAHAEELDLWDIDWLIVGGESGPKHRPIKPEWVRALRDHAQDESVKFFFKQWGGNTPKANGRELDGRTWDEMPEVIANAAAA